MMNVKSISTTDDPLDDLSYHKDWYSLYSDSIISENTFKYLDVSFYEIARLTRK